MSKTRENQLWNWLDERRPEGCVMERIENSVGDNTPDVLGLYQKATFTIELKVADAPKGGLVRVKNLTDGQAGRNRLWARLGARAWILVQVMGHGRFLVSGHYAAHLLKPVTVEDLTNWAACSPDCTAFQILRSASYR